MPHLLDHPQNRVAHLSPHREGESGPYGLGREGWFGLHTEGDHLPFEPRERQLLRYRRERGVP